MAQRRLSMRKIREIMRLNDEHALSQRGISRALDISRPVVSDYISKIHSANLNYQDIKDISDDALLEILNNNGRKTNKRFKALESKFEYFAKELKRVGVTKQILWEEYIEENPGGYSYSQFCYHFQIWQNFSELTMHMDHKAGDKIFADFTGKKLSITDRMTGKTRDVEVFVGLLGASQLTYVEAVMNQKKQSWIRVNENTLRYFGGVPQAIVPDCLKSAVTKGDKYEPDINPEYLDFARHYDTTILPARPNKPKDKALVEGAVNIVYSWIFAKLRNDVFYSLEELNRAIREKLVEYNSKPMQILNVSRRELFNEIERSELKPLPVKLYEIKEFKKLIVRFNYHIYLKEDKHYYSVPYRYRNKEVDVLYTDSILEVYYKNIRIAFHKRSELKGKYTTLDEHMHPDHRWKNGWHPEKFINWAASKGNAVKNVIMVVLDSRQHPEQSYKTCLGIINLSNDYGDKRLNKACERAAFYGQYKYKWIKNILKNGLESVDEEQSLFEKPLPNHENIRGNQYYEEEAYNEQPGNC